MQKTVSVVITTHNRPDYLKESLAAVLKQTVPPKEVFVIDDGSSVSYEEVLSLFRPVDIWPLISLDLYYMWH